MFRRPPLPFFHPVTLIATWFGSGLMAGAPGTWGSLAALPFAALLVVHGGPLALALATVVAFVLGIWASGRYARASRESDPGNVVIDEVAGQWLALLPAALDWRVYLIGFLAFRLFDIAKLWPANWLDRRVKGALGIMVDDIAAGLYAAAVCYGATLWFRLESPLPWSL